jgi:hypothetical protein
MKEKKNNKDPLVIYWAPHARLDREHQQILLDIKPKPIQADIQRRRAKNLIQPPSLQREAPAYLNGYWLCAALHTFSQNLFVVRSPFPVEIQLNNEGTIMPADYTGFFHERASSIENAFSVDFDIGMAMFSEESVMLSLLPPFAHQTHQPKSGFINFAHYDISAWFRPVVFIYQFWEGVNHLTIEKDEPVAYLKFDTDRPIVFKEFALTDTLNYLMDACSDHKSIIPYQSMNELYQRFRRTGLQKRVIAEIKKNVIE